MRLTHLLLTSFDWFSEIDWVSQTLPTYWSRVLRWYLDWAEHRCLASHNLRRTLLPRQLFELHLRVLTWKPIGCLSWSDITHSVTQSDQTDQFDQPWLNWLSLRLIEFKFTLCCLSNVQWVARFVRLVLLAIVRFESLEIVSSAVWLVVWFTVSLVPLATSNVVVWFLSRLFNSRLFTVVS